MTEGIDRTYRASSFNGTQTASGNAQTAGDGNSTGDASAEQSGNTRGNGNSTYKKVEDDGAGNRTEEKVTGDFTGRGKVKNTSSGTVSTGPDGVNSDFDLKSSTKGSDEYTTNRNADKSQDDGTGNTSRRRSNVTRTDKPSADITVGGSVDTSGGQTTVNSGLSSNGGSPSEEDSENLSGTTGNETSVDYDIHENSRKMGSGGFAIPEYYTAKGKVTDDGNATFSVPEDPAERHAELVRKATEDSEEKAGKEVRYTDPVTNEEVVKGERVKRTIDGNRDRTSSSDLDSEGEPSGDASASGSGNWTDTVEQVTWNYRKGADKLTKYDRTDTSKLTTKSGTRSDGDEQIPFESTKNVYKWDEMRSVTEDPVVTEDAGETTTVESIDTEHDYGEQTVFQEVTTPAGKNAQATLRNNYQKTFEDKLGTRTTKDFAESGSNYYDASHSVDTDLDVTITENKSTYFSQHDVLPDGRAIEGEYNTTFSNSTTKKNVQTNVGRSERNSGTPGNYVEDMYAEYDTTIIGGISPGGEIANRVFHKGSESGSYLDVIDSNGQQSRQMTGEFHLADGKEVWTETEDYGFGRFDGIPTTQKSYSRSTTLDQTDVEGNFNPEQIERTTTVTHLTRDRSTADRDWKYALATDTGGQKSGEASEHVERTTQLKTVAKSGEEPEKTGFVIENVSGTRSDSDADFSSNDWRPLLNADFYANHVEFRAVYPGTTQEIWPDDQVLLFDLQGNLLEEYSGERSETAFENLTNPPAPPKQVADDPEYLSQAFERASDDSWWWAGLKAGGKTFAIGLADVITDEIPYVAQVKAVDKLVNDRNLVTGEDDLSAFERGSSVVDLIPFGSTVKRAGKGFGALFGLGVDTAQSINRNVRRTSNAAENATSLATTAAKQADNRVDDFYELSNEALDNQLPVIQPKGGCFAADTPVSTPDGLKPIGEFQPGDVVLAFNHELGTWQPRRVEKVHRNFYEDSLVTIHTETDSIQATVYHPLWVISGRNLDDRPACQELSPQEDERLALPGRWVNSHDLRPGDVLVDTSGRKQYVLRTEQEFVSGFAIVNLTIEGDHTFAVGDAGVLVHNTGPCPDPVAVDVDTTAGSAGVDRSGKTFTAKTKKEIDEANAAKFDGVNRCENCGVEAVPAKQSKRGVTPPLNERHRDHIIPRSRGGDGTLANGQILCRECNLIKRDTLIP